RVADPAVPRRDSRIDGGGRRARAHPRRGDAARLAIPRTAAESGRQLHVRIQYLRHARLDSIGETSRPASSDEYELIARHLRNAWHHGLVGGLARRCVEESRVCGAVARGASAAVRAGAALFDRSERALGRASQPDRDTLSLLPLADLPPALAAGKAVRVIVDLTGGWSRAWEESGCARLLAREQAVFARAPRTAIVMAIGVAWLTATAVHVLLAAFGYEPASWVAWAVSIGLGVALVAARSSIADAWTAITERRRVPAEQTVLTRVRM